MLLVGVGVGCCCLVFGMQNLTGHELISAGFYSCGHPMDPLSASYLVDCAHKKTSTSLLSLSSWRALEVFANLEMGQFGALAYRERTNQNRLQPARAHRLQFSKPLKDWLDFKLTPSRTASHASNQTCFGGFSKWGPKNFRLCLVNDGVCSIPLSLMPAKAPWNTAQHKKDSLWAWNWFPTWKCQWLTSKLFIFLLFPLWPVIRPQAC